MTSIRCSSLHCQWDGTGIISSADISTLVFIPDKARMTKDNLPFVTTAGSIKSIVMLCPPDETYPSRFGTIICPCDSIEKALYPGVLPGVSANLPVI